MCQLKKVWWPWKLIAYRTDAQGSGWPVGAALTAMGGGTGAGGVNWREYGGRGSQ